MSSPPTTADRAWLADVLGTSRFRASRLVGGITSSVHAITPETGPEYVLRRWLTCDPREAADAVYQEADVLSGLESSGLPVPRLAGMDPDAAYCSAPALLMTRLPGRVVLTPQDVDGWLRQLAGMLPRIHGVQVAAPTATHWHQLDALLVPEWTSDPGLWRAALDLFAQPQPDGERCFIHHDYQQFNVLWTGAALTGVVDWSSGSIGSPDVDVAHARLNLTLLYSAERADRFRDLYESAAGRRVEPWWDVAGLLDYLPGWGSFLQQQAGRLLVIDFVGMHDRVEQVLRGALNRALA